MAWPGIELCKLMLAIASGEQTHGTSQEMHQESGLPHPVY